MAQGHGIVVLGMHRSGTSALSGLLHLHGVHLGEVYGAWVDNPKGYWENIEINTLNEDIMKHLNCRWDWPWSFPEGWISKIPVEFEERRNIIIAKFEETPLWGIKEPRMCRLFSWWQVALENQEAKAHIILCVRHPVEVAASLTKRDSIDQEHGLVLWLRYVLDSERYSRGLSRMVVFYEDIVKNPRKVIHEIQEKFNVSFTGDISLDAVEEFITPSLRHHTDSTHVESQIGVLCCDLFDHLKSPDWERDFSFFDEAIQRLNNIFIDNEENRLAWFASKLWDASKRADENRARSISLNSDLQWTQNELSSLRQKLSSTCQELSSTCQEFSSVQQELSFVRQEFLQAQGELASTRQNLLSEQQELVSIRQELGDIQKNLQELYCSRSWRLTRPLRWCSAFACRFLSKIR